jgi:predicted GNAT family N-acyltransferase
MSEGRPEARTNGRSRRELQRHVTGEDATLAGSIDIHEASRAERDAAFALRLAVFCDEQGVPRELELDAHENIATHVVAVAEGEVVGTLRWRPICGGARVKIERVAVARQARSRGLGRALMLWALGRLDAFPIRDTVLHAQVYARSFYERLGYAAEGEPFDEDGIEHIRMRRLRPEPVDAATTEPTSAA